MVLNYNIIWNFILINLIVSFTSVKREGDQGWKLVWEEPFDTLDRDIWSFDLGNHGWGNGEKQMYTDRRENAFVKDGVLNIALLRDPHYGWTSARMTSIFGFKLKYGKIKVRMRLDKGAHGIFPAFWLLPTYNVYGIWPSSGEIDLFEYQSRWSLGKLNNVSSSSALHFGAHHAATGLKFESKPIDVEKFFEITCIWESDSISFHVDDIWYGEYRRPESHNSYTWPYDQFFHFVINNAMQPSWGTAPCDDLMESYYQIDYIRVYEGVDKAFVVQ
jgi:beta-glucanase (GH16 family)